MYLVPTPLVVGIIKLTSAIISKISLLYRRYANDAKKVWIEAALEEGIKIDEPDSIEDYFGKFKLRIPKTLI